MLIFSICLKIWINFLKFNSTIEGNQSHFVRKLDVSISTTTVWEATEEIPEIAEGKLKRPVLESPKVKFTELKFSPNEKSVVELEYEIQTNLKLVIEKFTHDGHMDIYMYIITISEEQRVCRLHNFSINS